MRLPRVCVALLAVVVAGCSANGQGNPAYVVPASYARAAPPCAAPTVPTSSVPAIHVRLKAYDDTNLTDEYEVNSTPGTYRSTRWTGEGNRASTTKQLEQSLVAKMKGRIAQDPKINIEITTYAPFYIYGEVKKAGVYPSRPGLTVADAIATAGG